MGSMKMLLALIMTMVSAVMGGVVYRVGDDAGWTNIGHVDYKNWAATKVFQVGDTILFRYKKEFHNVVRVTYHNFVTCNSTTPYNTFTSGNDSFPIKFPGHFYFICTMPDHCQAGQKVDIRVPPAGAHSSPPSSPTTLPPFPAPQLSPIQPLPFPYPPPTSASAPTSTKSPAPAQSPAPKKSPSSEPSPAPKLPKQSPAPTLPKQSPAPTLPKGSPAPTLPKGSPAPTLPKESPAPKLPKESPPPTLSKESPPPAVPKESPPPTAAGPAPEIAPTSEKSNARQLGIWFKPLTIVMVVLCYFI